jgi:DNA-binding NarL/FixJ family response regulator
MNNPIRLIIADDHEVYRDGLQLLLIKDDTIEVVAQANNGRQLVELAKQMRPDVIITDLKMPQLNGIEAIREITTQGGSVRMLALSTFDNENLIVEALEAGALGYVIKNAQRGEILDAVKTVYSGKPYYCLSTTPHFAKKISYSSFNPYPKPAKEEFTEKERQIITLICDEATNREIAKELYVNKRTIERIRAQLLEKMNVKTAAGLVIYAIKNGLYHFT